METLMLSASDSKTAATAANLIMNGELVAIPTETVYGLGANGLDKQPLPKFLRPRAVPRITP